MKLKTSFLASCMIAAGIVGANAADAVIAEEPVPVVSAPVFTWAGPYIGGQVGYGWGRSKFSNDEDTLKMKPDGFLGGIYAGYNLDVGDNFILGIDGDVTYNDLDKGISHYDPEDDDAMEISTRLRWSGAVRARAGVSFDRWMPYIAGGVAFGNVKTSVRYEDYEDDDYIAASYSKTMTGWTLGAGVDYAVTDNLIARLEYRYTDYGHKDYTSYFDDEVSTVRNKFQTHDIRLGIAYKF